MTAGNMRRVFSNRNVLVTSLTNSITTFFNMIYFPYWAIYLEGLGMSLPQIGLLSALQRSQMLLFTLPGGLLADRIGRKKVTLIGAGTSMVTPVFYLLAGQLIDNAWELLVIGTIFSALQSISMAAYDAMIAESLPRNLMGSGYGALGMMRRVPMLFTGIVGGVLMDTYGVHYGSTICFIGVFIGAGIVLVSRWLFLTETLKLKEDRDSSLIQDFKEVLPLFKGSLQAMQVTSAIYQFSVGLTSQLIILWVIDYIGFSYTEWGLISTCMSVIGFITSIPGGMMADRYDRVKLNFFARIVSPVTTIGYIYLRDFYQILSVRMVAGVGMGLSGAEIGFLGGPAWSSLIMDLVPTEKRGRVNGLMSTFSGLVGFPSPYIGAYMWDSPSVGPVNAMWATILIGLLSTGVFGIFVKDPKFQKARRREEEETELRGGE